MYLPILKLWRNTMTNFNTIDNKIFNDDHTIEKPYCCPVCGSANTIHTPSQECEFICLDCCDSIQQSNGDSVYSYDEEMTIVANFTDMCDVILRTSHNYVNPVLMTELNLYRDKYKETLDQYFESSYMWQMRVIYSVIYSASHRDMSADKRNELLDDVFEGILNKISSTKSNSLIDPKIITEAKNIIANYQQYFERDLKADFNATILSFIARKKAIKNLVAMPYMTNNTRYIEENDKYSGDFASMEQRFHKRIFIMCKCNPVIIFFFYMFTLVFMQITAAVFERTFLGGTFVNVLDPIQFVVCLVLYLRTISSLTHYLLGDGCYRDNCNNDYN